MGTQQNDFHRLLLESVQDGVYFTDRDRTITFWNKAAERLTGYRCEEVVGRRCQDNILCHVDEHGRNLCCSDCPLVHAIRTNQPQVTQVFLRHRDGHRVPVRVQTAPVHDAQGNVIGAVEVFNDNTQQRQAQQRLHEMERLAYLDPLTCLANRRFASLSLAIRLQQLRNEKRGFGIALLDIDHFKRVNDQFGHVAGDYVLQMVARTLSGCTHNTESVMRWGGEEFLLIVDNPDPLIACEAAERCRALVEKSDMPINRKRLHVTVSGGVTMAAAHDNVDTLLDRVDQLLYCSKAHGRNHITVDPRCHELMVQADERPETVTPAPSQPD